MIVTLMSEDKLYDVLLPEKIRGCYWIEDPDLEIIDKRKKIVSLDNYIFCNFICYISIYN